MENHSKTEKIKFQIIENVQNNRLGSLLSENDSYLKFEFKPSPVLTKNQMNYTLFHLSSSLCFLSPFLSIPKNLRSLNLFMSRVYFQQSFSHFLFTQSKFANFQIENSKFKNFLSSVIKVNTIDFSNKYFYKESLSYKEDVGLHLNGIVFESCSSMSMGGAIQILTNPREASYINITECLFDKCYALVHGGAIYALVSKYHIFSSCFKYCWARDKQVASLRSESDFYQTVNFSTIYLNGIQSNIKYDDGNDLDSKNSLLTTFSSFSTAIAVFSINNTKNVVSGNSAGYYIISNFIAYLKYSTFSNNSGEKTLHVSFKNNSSIEYLNMVNNTSFLKYKGLIFCSAKAAFEHIIFLHNLHPLIRTSQQGSAFLIDCFFDFKENHIRNHENNNENDQNINMIFLGNVSYTNCFFDNILTQTYEFREKPPELLCINNFSSDNHSNGIGLFFWISLIFGFFLICGSLFSWFYQPFLQHKSRMKCKKEEEIEERVPFINKRKEKLFL